jgi:hypothetical protein
MVAEKTPAADESRIRERSVSAGTEATLEGKDKPQQEVSTMAATIFTEVETGTCSGRVHPHNGYYAGDFSTSRRDVPDAGQGWSSAPTPLVSRTA